MTNEKLIDKQMNKHIRCSKCGRKPLLESEILGSQCGWNIGGEICKGIFEKESLINIGFPTKIQCPMPEKETENVIEITVKMGIEHCSICKESHDIFTKVMKDTLKKE